ncbi:MAG: VTT domain-containing protein [Bacteroidota bacterium]
MQDIFAATMHHLRQNTAFYSFFALLILALGFIVPIPTTLILYLNGMVLGVVAGTLFSLASMLIIAIIGYAMGINKMIPFRPENNPKAGHILSLYGHAAIFLTRGIPVLSEQICYVCGFKRFDFTRFLALNFIGFLPICSLHAIFGNMGYLGGEVFLFSFTASNLFAIALWYIGKKGLLKNEWVKKNPIQGGKIDQIA